MFQVVRQSGSTATQDGDGQLKKAKMPCMHADDGCAPVKGQANRGVVVVLHNEPEPFKFPRGVKFKCGYCRKHGPPLERTNWDFKEILKGRSNIGSGGILSNDNVVSVTAQPFGGESCRASRAQLSISARARFTDRN